MVNSIDTKNFRDSLRVPAPKVRRVPAFTIQSLQRNTKVIPLPRRDLFSYKTPKPSLFRRNYMASNLPITAEFESGVMQVKWTTQIDLLDMHFMLPIFFEGLTETQRPYKFLVERGIHDLLTANGHKVLPVIPQLIVPIKNALNTKHPVVLVQTLKVLKHLATCGELTGEALVPFYRQILPVLNLYCLRNKNLWDGIDYSQQKGENIGDLVQETLETFERYGGDDAFINIKYMVPTYESCLLN